MSANKEVTFKPGDFVVKAKTACTALYIVKEGQLEVYKTDKEGKRIPIGIIGSGEYIGESALILETLHSSNVVALTPVVAIKIDKDAIAEQLENTPAWFISLTKGLVTRLHHINDILRRNGIVDETLAEKVATLEKKGKEKKYS